MEIDKKYHGYLTLPRQSRLLARELGYGLFGFYLDLVMITVWDRRNKNFGRIIKTQSELARELNMEQSTISRNFTALQKRNRYTVIKHKNYLLLGYFPLFLSDIANKIYNKNYIALNDLYADVYWLNAKMQKNYGNLQDLRTQKAAQSIYLSSNDEVSSPVFNDEEESEFNLEETEE